MSRANIWDEDQVKKAGTPENSTLSVWFEQDRFHLEHLRDVNNTLGLLCERIHGSVPLPSARPVNTPATPGIISHRGEIVDERLALMEQIDERLRVLGNFI